MSRLCWQSVAKATKLLESFHPSLSICRLRSSDGRPPVPLGGRRLTNPESIFQHNMWDHVEWTEEENEIARQKAEENSLEKIPPEEQAKYETDASQFWESFYEIHQNKFFKDRRWLFQEFPELFPPGPAPTDAFTETIDTQASGGLEVTSHLYAPPPGSQTLAGKDRMPEERASAQTQACSKLTEIQSSLPIHFKPEGKLENREGLLGTQELFPDIRERTALESDPLGECGYAGHHASFRILEVGCGAGNSVFPILRAIRGQGGFLYCCDFSSRAVQLVKDHPDYDDKLCDAFVLDVCDKMASFPFPPCSLDVILLVFVLSAIQPHRLQDVVNRLASYLKPGGAILFRDYGRYDLSQLRFKKGQCLSENFYSRRDGTCVYFFTKGEVHDLFTAAGLEEVQNLEDRRLQVNRAKKVIMRRVWMQAKFRKPLLELAHS